MAGTHRLQMCQQQLYLGSSTPHATSKNGTVLPVPSYVTVKKPWNPTEKLNTSYNLSNFHAAWPPIIKLRGYEPGG